LFLRSETELKVFSYSCKYNYDQYLLKRRKKNKTTK